MPQIRNELGQFVSSAMGEVNNAMLNASRKVAREMYDDLVNKLGHQGRRGYHSAPGEYPFRQSGNLIRKLRLRVTEGESGPNSSTIEFRSTANYSEWLHRLRPFMDLFFADWAQKFPDRMNHYLQSELSSHKG